MLFTIDAAKKAAKRLHNAIKAAGASSKLPLCHEIIAKGEGYADWHHLSKAIGTPNAPKEAPQGVLANLIAAKWPELANAAAQIAETAAPADRAKIPAEAIHELRRTWLASVKPPKYDVTAQQEVNHSRGSTPHKQPKLEGFPDYDWDAEIITFSGCSDEPMKIREACFRIAKGDEAIGYIAGTLYDRHRREGMAPADLIMLANDVGETDAWTIKNLQLIDPNLFDASVFVLRDWQLAPEHRGQGLGAAALIAAMKHLKRHYRRFQAVGFDPQACLANHPYTGANAKAITEAITDRFSELVTTTIWLSGALGPYGQVLPFSNARQFGDQETQYEIMRMRSEGTLESDSPMPELKIVKDVLWQHTLARHAFLNSLIGKEAPPPPPKILPVNEYPKGWPVLLFSMGLNAHPYPELHQYMPHEMTNIEVIFNPPDLDLRDTAVVNRPREIICKFANGEEMILDPANIPHGDIKQDAIAACDKKYPSSGYAPSLGHGTILAIVSSNIRLLFGVNPDPKAQSEVPILMFVSLKPIQRTTLICHDWTDEPGEPRWPTVKAALDAAVKAGETRIRDQIAELTRATLLDGSMEQEFYDDVWKGEKVLRQRFHQKDWPDDIGAKTFKEIGMETSPTTPHSDSGCPAHEAYIQRLKRVLIAALKTELLDLFTSRPKLMPAVIGAERTDPLKLRLRQLTFFGTFWAWWQQTVHEQIEAYQHTPLQRLASKEKK